MFEKFTERARRIMSLARQEAQRLEREFIDTEHILLAILQEGGGIGAGVLKNLNVDLKRIRQEIEQIIQPSSSPALTLGQLPFSPGCKRTIELAGEAADQLHTDTIGTEHLLIGLLREGHGIAAQVLTTLGIGQQDLVEQTRKLSPARTPPRVAAPAPVEIEPFILDRPALQSSVLTALRAGRSVALTGARGVGKTSLLKSLARTASAGFDYRSLPFGMPDPFRRPAAAPAPPGTVWVAVEAELLTAGRGDAGEIFRRTTTGGLFILEFRDGTWDPFHQRFPDLAGTLVQIPVAAPDPDECRFLLQAAIAGLKKVTGYAVDDATLQEADQQCRDRVRSLLPPWGTTRALWDAVPLQKDLTARGDMHQLEKDIEQLEREGSPHVDALKKHLEGLRASERPELSIECVRVAIAKLARDAG